LSFALGSFLTNISLHSSQSSTYKLLQTNHSSIILIAREEPTETKHHQTRMREGTFKRRMLYKSTIASLIYVVEGGVLNT
jgi:hypothetical protein